MRQSLLPEGATVVNRCGQCQCAGAQHEGNQFILPRKTVQNAVRKFKLYSCTWRISGNYSLTFHSLETPSYSCIVAAGAWLGQGAEAKPGAGSNEGAGAGASAGEGAGNKDDKEGPLAPTPTGAQGYIRRLPWTSSSFTPSWLTPGPGVNKHESGIYYDETKQVQEWGPD